MRNSPIIALIDMDCFYVQVEWHDVPSFKGEPSAVVQYNSWRGGSIIAVSYEARDKGVIRGMRGDEAREKCPGIHLFSVPELRGKADLTRYRNAGADVIKCLSTHANLVERASVDEAYIDLTDEVDNLLIADPDHEDVQGFWRRELLSIEGCHSVGYESYDLWLDHVWEMRESDEYCDDVRLALASYLVRKMRDSVFATLGYRCSAGIAHSKITAKYACGVHKPNQQTTVPSNHVATLFQDASIHKIRNLGGKLGKIVQERLNITTMGQLSRFSLSQLSESFGDRTGPWLYSLCRGNDDDGVVARQLAQSIGCSKTFPGGSKLDTLDKVRHWVGQMAQEIVERVEQDRSSNGRVPSHLCVNYRQLRADISHGSKRSISGSRVVPLGKLTIADISTAALVVLAGINNAGHQNMAEQSWHPPLLSLGLSAGKFRPQVAKNDISRYLIDAPMNCAVAAVVADHKNGHGSTSKVIVPESNGLTSVAEASSIVDTALPSSLDDGGGAYQDTVTDTSAVSLQSIIKEEEVLNTRKINIASVTPVRKGFFARRLEQEEKERQQRTNIFSENSLEEQEPRAAYLAGQEKPNLFSEDSPDEQGLRAAYFARKERTNLFSEDSLDEQEPRDAYLVGQERTNLFSEDSPDEQEPRDAYLASKERTNLFSEDLFAEQESPTAYLARQKSVREGGFFAKRIAREKAEREERDERMNHGEQSSTAVVASDYMRCEHCNQQILMWDAPEHLDWHMARQVQKELYRQVMDEDAVKRRVLNAAKDKLRTADARNGKGRPMKRKAKEIMTNQKTIDNFFGK